MTWADAARVPGGVRAARLEHSSPDGRRVLTDDATGRQPLLFDLASAAKSEISGVTRAYRMLRWTAESRSVFVW